MIFWVIYKLIKKEKLADCLLCIIVISYSILGKIFNAPIGWMVETMGFVYGILIYYNYSKLAKIKKWKYFVLIGISTLILGILYLKYKEIYMLGTWLLKTILGINLLLLLTILLNNIEINSKILQYIGGISYEMYLIHGIINTLLINVNIPSVLWILLVIILTIISATVLKFIDNKLIKLIKK